MRAFTLFFLYCRSFVRCLLAFRGRQNNETKMPESAINLHENSLSSVLFLNQYLDKFISRSSLLCCAVSHWMVDGVACVSLFVQHIRSPSSHTLPCISCSFPFTLHWRGTWKTSIVPVRSLCTNRYKMKILLRTQNATIQNCTYLTFCVRVAKQHQHQQHTS